MARKHYQHFQEKKTQENWKGEYNIIWIKKKILKYETKLVIFHRKIKSFYDNTCICI